MSKRPISYEFNQKVEAKSTDFGGWQMPTFYTSIIEEHELCRKHIGLFDVSHMGRWWFTGKHASDFINRLITNDLSKVKNGKGIYSPMCNEDGGIIDDLIVYKFNEEKFLVVNNAGNHDIDSLWYREQLELIQRKDDTYEIELDDITTNFGQIAVQGPKAKEALAKILSIDEDPKYFHFTTVNYKEQEIIIASTGYTGEAGYELYGPNNLLMEIWQDLIDHHSAKACGLGARDVLRLEAGYCLHGNDISKETSPFEAGLEWTVKLNKDNFIGKDKVTCKNKKLVGISFPVGERVIPRHGSKLFNKENQEIGSVTSGNFSPLFKRGIALAYINIDSELAEDNSIGKEILLDSRGKKITGKICEPWFYRNIKGPEYSSGVKEPASV